MGTRALTTIKDNEGSTVVCIYRQSDGYQECHGSDLKKFLNNIHMVNGIPYGDERKLANGMGCLAAQLISNLKDKVGLFYLYPEGKADDWVDYKYTIYPEDDSDNTRMLIKVESHGDIIFDGLASEYEAVDIEYED